MLTFEKILKVFQAYLDDDPLYEVVQTSHGYTLMAWEPHRNDWYSAEIQKTPEDLRNALLGTYANFLEDRNHISNVMLKLGVKGRAQAVVELLKLEELTLE